VPAEPTPPNRWDHRLLPYLVAVAAVSMGLVVRSVVTPVLGSAFPFITLFPAVFVTAFVGGFWPTCLATGLSVLFTLSPFSRPQFALSLENPADQIGILFYVVSGLATGWLAEVKLRSQQRERDFSRRVRLETERAEAQAIRAEEEAARAEEEAMRAEEERIRAEDQAIRADNEARRATAESERVEHILTSITDAFMVLGHNWTITYMNDRAAALAGRKPADFIGRNHWEVFPEALGGPFETAFKRAMSSGEVVRVEAYYRPVNRWLHATAYPSGGGLTVVSQDVTDRVRGQEDTARLAAIVASSDDAIVGKDLDGTVTSWNAAAERIFGYSAAEMVGRSIYTLIPPELYPVEEQILSQLAHGRPVEFSETERIRKDGTRIFIALSISPIRDASGRVIGTASIKRDITAVKRVREALTAASARSDELAQALDAAQVLMRDMEGRITYWSSGATRLYGWLADEALGRISHELLRTEFPTPFPELQAELLARGQWEGELIHVAKDGRRLNIASQWVLQGGEGTRPPSVIEVSSDMTAQRQIEERIRQTERLEVVGQLAGGVAHEANNQMTVVLGAADFVLRRHDLPDIVRADVEHIRRAADRTASITAQLLAFSRRQVFRPQPMELDQMVQEVAGVLQRTLGGQTTLMLQLGAGTAKVLADPGQLTQVLLNFALNARDAMPAGGRVTIETTVTELTEGYVQQHAAEKIKPGQYVLLSFSDTGHGMSAETMRHIFEPFYTTKPMGQGTGLGLATVYGIIKQSGGYVWAYSESGQGTVFKMYLPLEEGPVPRVHTPPSPHLAAGETILLVEDEPAVRQMASRALQEHGYLVLEAGSGPEALELVQRSAAVLDLLVSDVVMPGLDGAALARDVVRLMPDVPVLYISGYTDDEIVRRGLLESGVPFLAKPFTPDDIIQRVGELLKARARRKG
jgi:two-component system cell cycle sensor histidine kinase/response regulator CckA